MVERGPSSGEGFEKAEATADVEPVVTGEPTEEITQTIDRSEEITVEPAPESSSNPMSDRQAQADDSEGGGTLDIRDILSKSGGGEISASSIEASMKKALEQNNSEAEGGIRDAA